MNETQLPGTHGAMDENVFGIQSVGAPYPIRPKKIERFFPAFFPGGQNNGEPSLKSGDGSVDELKKQENKSGKL